MKLHHAALSFLTLEEGGGGVLLQLIVKINLNRNRVRERKGGLLFMADVNYSQGGVLSFFITIAI
jgi:hypothetical protein